MLNYSRYMFHLFYHSIIIYHYSVVVFILESTLKTLLSLKIQTPRYFLFVASYRYILDLVHNLFSKLTLSVHDAIKNPPLGPDFLDSPGGFFFQVFEKRNDSPGGGFYITFFIWLLQIYRKYMKRDLKYELYVDSRWIVSI